MNMMNKTPKEKVDYKKQNSRSKKAWYKSKYEKRDAPRSLMIVTKSFRKLAGPHWHV